MKIYQDGDTSDGDYMVVMRYYEPYNHFLEFEPLKRNKTYFQKIFLDEMEGLNEALRLIHEKGIFHSDIKPANVMQYEDEVGENHLVLIDFGAGVALKNNDASSVTARAHTMTYSAPELINRKKIKASEYTDYFSLGLTMAEFVAGRYPKRDDIVEDDYKEQNKDSAYTFYGMLLPKDLPDYLAKVFEGLLFYDQDLAENNKMRWTYRNIEEWIAAVRRKEYSNAVNLKTGRRQTVQEAEERKGRQKDGEPDYFALTFINHQQVKVEPTKSAMVNELLEHWDEAVDSMLRDPNFAKSFSVFGADIEHLFTSVRDEMLKNNKKREEIFDSRIIDFFLPDAEKKNQLRYRNLRYKKKQDLGEELYFVLKEEKKTGGGAYRTPNIEEYPLGKRDRYIKMMEMFHFGVVTKFLQTHPTEWIIDDRELRLLERIEKGLSVAEPNMVTLLEYLYRFAYCLMGKEILSVDGKDYTQYHQFLEDLKVAYETNIEHALEIQQQCFSSDGRMRIEYYTFLLKASGIKRRPTEADRPQKICAYGGK